MAPEDVMGEEADVGVDAVASSDAEAALQALRQRGASGWNPVRFRFIEALARRASAHRGAARRLLDGKLAQALLAYEAGFDAATQEGREIADGAAARFPESADALGRLHAAGDLAGLRGLVARLELNGGRQGEALADLVRHLQASTGLEREGRPDPASTATDTTSPGELKTLRYFRGDWSRLSVDQRMNQSETQVPMHAGPLNSQILALRALQQMREIAPDYLAHFMSYLDALLWLDQAGQPSAPPPKEGPRAERKPKEKVGRRKSA